MEQIGILLPFLLIPEKLANQHIIFRTDNIACVFGHQNRLMKGDESASIFIRTVHLICAYLGSMVHMEHTPRCSDWGSTVADKLSRATATGFLENQMTKRWSHLKIPDRLGSWFSDPVADWDIPFQLLDYVQERTSK